MNNRNNFFTLLGLVISLTGIFIVTTIFKLVVEHRTPLSVVLREGVIFLLLLFLIMIIRNKEQLKLSSIGLKSDVFIGSIGWGIAGAIACSAVAIGTLLLLQSVGLTMKSEGQLPLPLWTTGIVILRAGIIEEVFFRGYAIDRLRRLTGNDLISIGLPLFLFSAFHYSQGIAGVIVAFVMGSVLTLLFLWKRDLLAVIVAHLLIDFVPNILIPLISNGE